VGLGGCRFESPDEEWLGVMGEVGKIREHYWRFKGLSVGVLSFPTTE
jgi:hypothetical protein